jgi:hypothetical protein
MVLLACRAVHPIVGVTPATVAGPRIVVEIPPGWELDRNRRSPINQHLSLFNEQHASAINIDLVREDRSTRDLPLSLVTEGLALNGGRFMGIDSEHNATHELTVADREAWAVTTVRRHGPNERLISTVALRGNDHLAVLTLNTGTDAPPVVVLGWSQVLDSFEMPLDPAPPLNLLDPLDEELGPI